MKRFLALVITAFLAIGANLPVSAYAAGTDAALCDDAFMQYVQRSIDLDQTTGLSVAAVCGADAGSGELQ